ncbi:MULTISPECIES: helix-turn-helix domain-containing protein [Pseudomonas]|uniref:Helix-turn-helix domain-containing protein n=1 Tax=Pseudomonas poae TaxID=200451 RepID=A0AAP2S6G7_9PSED|nr:MULTISPECIES: helix-turn-helix domain-containing protein [Pseudomonas]AGE25224.1 AraC family transcriptional regulator [Pseudomonas poae RE*1-1-14]MBC3197921.1 helix-turn-helix domain-containing protein [Pseudomonas poae]MCF5657865.1 helix-turn-helix domain-containing protein [Pseudomonas poae]MCF5780046.1 helix-turn-helix domain-containing protein [Pseudomonas poae]NMZ50305.1 helix-turn-helix domain-containing protein [Pseudomonas poae]
MNNNNSWGPPTCPAPNDPGVLQRYRTHDIDQHARNMHGWQVRYDQLTPGRFDGELTALSAGWMQLVRDRANQSMLKSGRAWKGAITFSVPLSPSGPLFCAGHPLQEQHLLVAHGEHLPDLRVPAQLDLLSVAVDAQALERVLQRQGVGFRITDLPTCYRLAATSMQVQLARLFDGLATADQGPGSLLRHEAVRHGIRDAVMVQLLELIAPDQAAALSPTARKRMVDRAREYALGHLDEPLSILDLCNHIGASRRKLQYCFQETLGINPVAYLRALRLNAVRRELCAHAAVHGVQQVAARWGFWHLSRFASDYRTLFGESPSQTLHRR